MGIGYRQWLRTYGDVTANVLDFATGIIFAISVVQFDPARVEREEETDKVRSVVDELKKARVYGIVGVVTMMLAFAVKLAVASL